MKTERKQKAKKDPVYDFCLYIAGQSPKSLLAITNLRHICEAHLKGQYRIEVIDLLKDPRSALREQILAIPTVVKKRPDPVRKFFGDMSREERVLSGLNIRPDALCETADVSGD